MFHETFLHDGIYDNKIKIRGFSIIQNHCSLRFGGGVCVYVRNPANLKIVFSFLIQYMSD